MRGAWLALALLVAGPAWALDPGTASGAYERDGVTITFTHAIALSQDNAEGLYDHPHQMRVLLSDREVPISALEGLIFPPVRAMAKAGEVRGLLLEFDPADRTSMQVTPLAKPDDPSGFLGNLSLSNSEGLWRRLEASATRVVGEFQPADGLAFSFSAPVFADAIIADLKGVEAQGSEPVKVLLARAQAIGRGDLAGTLALTSKSTGTTLSALPPESFKQAAGQAPEMISSLKSVKRVIVRHDTASVQTGDGEWSSLVREGGAWKVGD